MNRWMTRLWIALSLIIGVCERPDLIQATTTDSTQPAAGAGFVLLVTAENRLDERGTKGMQNNKMERVGATCP